jgi:hypothetical protein
LIVRYFVPNDQYPTGHWRNNELKIQTEQLEKLPKVDIMFTGSSYCSVNISPEYFDNEMKKNGISTISFNAGIRGCDYEGISEGFKKLFWSLKKSKYVVLVISPYDLDESNKGVRNRSKSFIKTFNIPSYEAKVIDFLSNSWLFGFRNEIKDYFETGEWKYEYPLVGDRGNTPMYRETNLEVADNRTLVINEKDTIYQSLFNLVNYLSEDDKKVIIIEAVHINLVREKIYPEISEIFQNILSHLDNIRNAIILDIEDIHPEDKYFIDSGHLSVEGAKLYARDLARKFVEAGFPWEKIQ